MLALGTRLGPFGTLPQYDIDYWPKNAKLIQVDIDASQLGISKKVDVAIMADAKEFAMQLLEDASIDRRKAGEGQSAPRRNREGKEGMEG